MNGSHGEKTPLLMRKDKMKGFKGTSEMLKNLEELRVWQKVYQQKTCDSLDSCLLAGGPETSWGTL
jgi:hypothetical protein